MKLVLPMLDALPDLDRQVFEALRAQIARTWQVSNTDDGHPKRTLLSVYHNQTQSHTTSAAFEAVSFNSEDDLRAIPTITVPSGVHDTTTRPDRFVVPGEPGSATRWVRIRARVAFAANATGDRSLRILLNDAVVRRPAFVRAATATGPTRLTITAGFPVSPGDAVHIEAYQDSGGALTLGSTDRADANECEWELI